MRAARISAPPRQARCSLPAPKIRAIALRARTRDTATLSESTLHRRHRLVISLASADSTLSAPPAAPSTPTSASRRLWEVDALRGAMLVLMTITHIPTRFSNPLGQPLGFVSAAEGFVLLSGFVAGMAYTQRQLRDGDAGMRDAFLKRALKLYLCQAALLVFLLTFIALFGVVTEQPAITDLVSFFLERPLTAAFSGLLLLYNPPLLDILPMYVVFMILSPLLLLHASRHGWSAILVGSAAIWLATQFGLSQAGYDALVRLTGMPVPFRETGAFEMLAWQFVWVLGLWIGSAQAASQPVQPTPFPRWTVRFALAYAGVHLVWRHAIGQAPFPADPQLSLLYDKWQLGPLRLVNFMCLVLLALHYGPWLARRLPRLRVLELLGRASLPVFCAHLVLAMLILVSFGAIDPKRPWAVDLALLVGCFAVLYAVARLSEQVDRKAAATTARFKERRAARRQQPWSAPERPFRSDPPARPDAPRSRAARARSPPG